MQNKGDTCIFAAAMAGKGGSPSFFAFLVEALSAQRRERDKFYPLKNKSVLENPHEIIDNAKNAEALLYKRETGFCGA